MCGTDDDEILESRKSDKARTVRRRRACKCGCRWTTNEIIEKGSATLEHSKASDPSATRVSPKVRFFVLSRDDFRCRYCGARDVELTMDHVIPMSAPIPDGQDRNDVMRSRHLADNLVTACMACNVGKSNTTGSPLVVLGKSEKDTTGELLIAPDATCSVGGVRGGLPSGSVPGLLFPDPIQISSSNSVEIAKTGARAKRIAGQVASPQFVEFWALWPRKVDRAASIASWNRQGLDTIAVAVMVGLRAQLAYFARSPIDKVPHGATWLNGRRWEADPSAFVIAPPATNGSAPAPSDSYCGPYHRDSRNWVRPSFTPKPTCPGCKHYRAANTTRASEPERLPDWMGPTKPAAWTPEQQAEAEALRKARG